MRLAIECRDADIRTGGLAVPSTTPTTIQDTRFQCGMEEITIQITMQITMPNTIPNTMPNLLRSYITENTIPNGILT